MEIRKYSDGNLYAGFEYNRAVFPVSNLDPNSWHLISLSWAPNMQMKLYVDGTLAALGSNYDGHAVEDNTRGTCPNICWGGWPGFSSARATMEDMQIFNYVLSGQQILDIYNSTVPAQFYYHAPVVGTISAPSSPQVVGAVVGVSAPFSDIDTLDTHTAVWNWGDGNMTNGSVTESNGSGTVSGSHAYTQAGVYTVTLTVTDNSGLSGTNQYQYIVVYDPNGGFVTGAGLYDSPAGSYTANLSTFGKTQFGLQAKYVNGVLQGLFRLSFKDANFDFSSTASNWLVVTNGNTAQYQGVGNLNGVAGYTFWVTVVDNSATSTPDTIYVKIVDSSNTTIYDNQTEALNAGVVNIHN